MRVCVCVLGGGGNCSLCAYLSWILARVCVCVCVCEIQQFCLLKIEMFKIMAGMC